MNRWTKFLWIWSVVIGIACSVAFAIAATFAGENEALEQRLKEKEHQLTDLYFDMGCGSLPCERCETEWRHMDQIPIEQYGISPIGCADRNATVWVNPYATPDEPGSWTFRCVHSKP